MHVDLTHDQSAELRDAESFTRKERNDYVKRTPDEPDNYDKFGQLLPGRQNARFDHGIATLDEALATLVVSWTLDLPLPSVDRARLDELSAPDANLLEAAARKINAELLPSVDSPTVPPSDD